MTSEGLLFDNFILNEMTIGELFAKRVQETPDTVAVEFEGEQTTWAELDLLSDWLVKRFDSFGIHSGTRCAIWCGNHLQWIIVYIGLQKIGATAVLVNPGYLADELYRVLSYAQIEFLFYGETFKDQKMADIIDQLDLNEHPYLKQTIPIELDDAIRFMIDGARSLTAEDCVRIEALKAIPKPHDIACMLFTSGTTAVPKGVMLTHYNLVNCAKATVEAMHWNSTDKACVMVPLFHCFGMTSCLLGALTAGYGLYVMKYYRTLDALYAIEKCGCTILNGVPSMFLAMVHNHRLPEFDLSNLVSGIIAGSPIAETDYQLICEKLGMKHLLMSYGQTETSPGVTFSQYDETIGEKADNAGFVIPQLDAGIWDEQGQLHLCVEQGHFLNHAGGVTGEIAIRGFVVMREYYNRPNETTAMLQQDGWLHTGDRGFFDANGHLHVLGRLKDVIIRGGENISPAEIEGYISQIPQVKQVKVVGVPHPVLQEEIAAAIVRKDQETISEDAIRQYLCAHLAKYKIPAYIAFVDEIPMTESGKTSTGLLREMMMERFGISQGKGGIQ